MKFAIVKKVTYLVVSSETGKLTESWYVSSEHASLEVAEAEVSQHRSADRLGYYGREPKHINCKNKIHGRKR